MKIIDRALLGSIFELRSANRKLNSRIEEATPGDFDQDTRTQVSNEILDGELAKSAERIQRVEGKAMATLLGVGVAVTLLGLSPEIVQNNGIFNSDQITLRIIAGGLLVIAILYLFGSGLLALRAYRVSTVYRPSLSDHSPLSNSADRATILLYCIEQNYRMGTIRSNDLFVAFNLIFRGIVSIVFLGIFIILGVLLS